MDRSEANALNSKMETCFSKPNVLQSEDYARLGVRPNEYRLNIIRCAASRHSRALAERQLRTPSPQTALQLAQVATSAYRLLDPRNRRERSQRIYVGRILPLTLQGAGQTQFQTEFSKFGSTVGEIDPSAFEHKSLLNKELIQRLDLDLSHMSTSPVIPDRSRQSSQVVLARDARWARRCKDWFSHSRFRWISMAVLVLAVGLGSSFLLRRSMTASTSWRSVAFTGDGERGHTETEHSSDLGAKPPKTTTAVSFGNGQRRLEVVRPSSVNAPRSNSEEELPSPHDDQVAHVTSAGKQHQSVTGTESSGKLAYVKQNDSGGGRSRGSDQPSISSPVKSETANKRIDSNLTEESTTPSNGSSVWKSDVRISQNPVNQNAATQNHGMGSQQFLPDPFRSRTDLGTEEKISAGSSKADTDVGQRQWLQSLETASDVHSVNLERSFRQEITIHPVPLRVSLPDRADLELVRRQLIDLTPEIASSFEAETAHLRIEQLEWIEREYPDGSAERWVLRHWIAEAAWLVEPMDRVEQRLTGVVATHGLPIEPSLAETFVGAARYASLPKTREQLIGRGFNLADRFLVSSWAAPCQIVVTALEPFVSMAPSDDAVRKLINDFADAADLMSDQEALVANLEESPQDLKPDRAVMLGRIYCLLQRRWDEGLVWLSGSFNRQIANASRQELLLDEESSAEDLKKVAGLWLIAAEQNRGRMADSMRVHAIDLLERARTTASQLMRLEIDRARDDALSRLPRYLIQNLQGKSTASHRPNPRQNRFSEGLPLF